LRQSGGVFQQLGMQPFLHFVLRN